MKWIPAKRMSDAEIGRLVEKGHLEFTREMDMEVIRRVIEGLETAAKAKGWIVVWDVVEVF